VTPRSRYEPSGTVRRGRPPRIDTDDIVRVARTFDAADLTMQAVADQLGVDRKAINYHVSSREDLLRLVAADIFTAHIDEVDVDGSGDWRDALRAFATGMRRSVVATDSYAPYFHLPQGMRAGALRSVEAVLQALLRAGFDVTEAGRVLNLIAELALSAARNELVSKEAGVHPQVIGLTELLSGTPDDELVALRQVVLTHVGNWEDNLVDFDVRVVIAGLERDLEARGGGGSASSTR
jgi:TetR/AcrR family tetracycline transcriptional repressor